MRIALVGTRGVPAHYGGFETCVEEVGRRLAERGHDVVVYCRGERGPARHLGMRRVVLPALRRKSLETLSHTALSSAHLLVRPVDVAVVFNAANAPFLPVVRARGIPVATHVDGLEWQRDKWRGAGRRYYRAAEAMAVRWSDELIADAGGIADYYLTEFGAQTRRIAYGAPLLTRDRAERLGELGLHPNKYHLVVARFEPENHVDVVVDGYRRSAAELPLVVVGAAPYADEHTRRVHALADDRVTFLGGVWDQDLLDELYANALTYLHGHSVGGTNPSLLRALGGGTATIAYDVGFNREVLGAAGRWFRTADDVARELERAEADPAATLRRGEDGRTEAARYDWDAVADAYERLCLDLRRDGPRRRALRPSGRRQAPAATGRPRRVLVAHPSPDLYGSDRQLAESVAGLVAAGDEVTVCLPADGPLRDLLGDVAVRTVDFPVLRRAVLRPVALARLLLHLPADVARLARVIREERPDVVYVNTVTVPVWTLAARLARRPVVVHVHEAEEDGPRLVRRALYAPLVAATAVVANSEASRAATVSVAPGLDRRITVVVNGVPDPGRQPPERAEAGRLALVGRLSPRKGIDVALEAVARLRADGRGVVLDVCGSAFAGYEWYEAQLRERAAAPDLAGGIRFLGYVDPSSSVVARASAVLVPSRLEPFGNVAVEAQLAGRPVIASAVQGLREIVTDGRTGLLVPPDDPVALADAIARVLDDPALGRRLAVLARSEALDRFAPARYRDRIAEETHRVVARW